MSSYAAVSTSRQYNDMCNLKLEGVYWRNLTSIFYKCQNVLINASED